LHLIFLDPILERKGVGNANQESWKMEFSFCSVPFDFFSSSSGSNFLARYG
jgi:hypothetical protein